METLPPPSTISTLSQETQATILDTLFEPSPTLHLLSFPILSSNSYPTYSALISMIESLLLSLSASSSPSEQAQLDEILSSHPRLGEKKVDSALSRSEQAQLQGGRTEEEEELKRLNEAYEARFPGLKYVVFVNGRKRPEIMEDMRMRLGEGYSADLTRERETIIRDLCKIANDRANKLT